MGSRSAEAAGPSAGRVVVGVDGQQLSAAAIEFAFQTAARRGVGVTGVHAWKPPFAADLGTALADPHAAEEQRLRLLIDSFAQQRRNFPNVDVELKLVQAKPAHALVTESTGAELVVVGSPRAGRILRHGSVRRELLERAESPIAVVPAEPAQ